MGEVKKDLLERIHQTYQPLIDTLHRSDQQMTLQAHEQESWNIKDILAHVTVWEEILLRFHLSGEEFSKVVGIEGARYRETPFDEINQHLYERFVDKPFNEIMDYAVRIHAQVIHRLRQMDDEVLLAPAIELRAQGYIADPLISYVAAITHEHYLEHLQHIEELSGQTEQ